MSTNHTPGPWKIDRGSSTKRALGISASSRNIVNFKGLSAPRQPESEFNAMLIAAAPELLAVAKMVCENYVMGGDWKAVADAAYAAVVKSGNA